MNYLFNCIFFSILTLMSTPLVYGYQCEPPLTGAPCAQSSLTGFNSSEPSLNLGVGNPINLVTGNKYQLETDLPANPNMPGIEIIRHYNSSATVNSFFGYDWKTSYDTKLYKIANTIQIIQADGTRTMFSPKDLDHQNIYKNEYGVLNQIDDRYFWRWPNDTTLEFDKNGHLISIQWPNSEQLYIQRYDSSHTLAGAIQQVVNVREQLLLFHYNLDNLISQIDTVIGAFKYEYDDAKRLIMVIRPDGMRKHYGYDKHLQSNNIYALTSVGIQQTHNSPIIKTKQWQYDSQNRAVAYIDLLNQQNNLNLEYIKQPTDSGDGLTIVTNHIDQETRFITAKIANKHVLKQVTGSGCYSCAAVGTIADYDAKARLININNTKIDRYENGLPKTIIPNTNNWDQLRLNYNQHGLLESWASANTGKTTIKYNQHNLPNHIDYNHESQTKISYDAFKRPTEIIEQNKQYSINTQLEWYGNQLIKINHPVETETREYDELDRLNKRYVFRSDIEYSEGFVYDDNNRLIEHKLPEGGSLHYKWGIEQQLTAIYWQDLDGSKHTVIDSVDNHTGYKYGNQLQVNAAADDKHKLRMLSLSNPIAKNPKTVWSQYIDYDTHNRINQESFTLLQNQENWSYAYDDNGSMVGATNYDKNKNTQNNWYAWQSGGKSLATQTKTRKTKPESTINNAIYDASGLPKQIGDYTFLYGPDRRLKQVKLKQKVIANYTHNAYGFRTSVKGHKSSSNYLYLDNKLVAESNGDYITQRYIYAHLVPVALIQYNKDHGAELFFIHSDAQATPRLITDSKQNIRWQTQYTPFGYAYNTQGDISFDLRLAGQVFDANTQLHDNLLRTYDPKYGHYLEPDPLGPIPSNQSYGYVKQQPRNYVDPMGLLLFAFDGTRQSSSTNSNVWKMTQYYSDGPIYYHQGPGNSESLNWDALTASQAQKIIEKQWQLLLAELSSTNKDETIPIDIIGFSRGAALARHFGNQISQYVNQGLFEYSDIRYGSVSACVDLRFMGLFDSVAQFGVVGSQNHLYDLSINVAWEWVAHAIALNEHRWMFPLLIANDNGAYNVVEAPFIGAHSDIGGGVFPDNIGKEGGRSDLSKVALNWMLWQAKAASINFNNVADADTIINQPIIHDYRSNVIRSVQNGDRAIQNSSGKPMLSYQDDHPKFGKNTRQETEQFIDRPPNWRRNSGLEVGTVDMDGYTEWLNENLGWQTPL